ncbi:MAG: hypothetical protein ACSHXB_18740 [Sulfitobacter sp.]
MFKRVCVLAMFILGVSTQAIAGEADIITQDALRDAIYAGETQKVEDQLHRAQRSFETGTISADDMRRLFGSFAVTHPDVIRFTENWLKEYPASPYAQTAQAWIYFRAGWIVRGSKIARNTHPEAMEKHSLLHRLSLELAMRAYDANPKMIPASDAVIMLGNTGGQKQASFAVFEQAMQDTPNWGTIWRAFDFTKPGYGGSYELGEAMCDHYAPLVEFERNNMTRFCKISLLTERRHLKGWPEMALPLLNEANDPSLDYFKFLALLNTYPLTLEQANFVRVYFEAHPGIDLRWVEKYDKDVVRFWGFDLQTPRVLAHAKTNARAALVHDPYSPELLTLLERRTNIVTKTSTGYRYTPVKDDPSPADEIEYARRRLVVAPYNPKHWQSLARMLHMRSIKAQTDGADLFKQDVYFTNAIYYGQQDARLISDFLLRKLEHLKNVAEVEQRNIRFNGWDTLRGTLDRDADLNCPIIRAGRLLDYVDPDKMTNDDFQAGYQPLYDVVIQDAQANGSCQKELKGPADELWFDVVDVDVMQDDD